ncbi:MAG: DUF3285 domain-containing protein [Waterburya sp.]
MTDSTTQQIEEPTITPDSTAENHAAEIPQPKDTQPKDSYVKLAMRNMVRKGRQSLWHFFLTTVGLVGLLVGLAYLTKP